MQSVPCDDCVVVVFSTSGKKIIFSNIPRFIISEVIKLKCGSDAIGQA